MNFTVEFEIAVEDTKGFDPEAIKEAILEKLNSEDQGQTGETDELTRWSHATGEVEDTVEFEVCAFWIPTPTEA